MTTPSPQELDYPYNDEIREQDIESARGFRNQAIATGIGFIAAGSVFSGYFHENEVGFLFTGSGACFVLLGTWFESMRSRFAERFRTQQGEVSDT